MPHDAEGHNRCIACGLCQAACPNGTIHITTEMVTDPETGKSQAAGALRVRPRLVHVLPPVRQRLPARRHPLLDGFRACRLHARKTGKNTEQAISHGDNTRTHRFMVLALFTTVSAMLAVTTHRILRAATYLLFVLFGTAGIYFQLNYSFLGCRAVAHLRGRHHGALRLLDTAHLERGRQGRGPEGLQALRRAGRHALQPGRLPLRDAAPRLPSRALRPRRAARQRNRPYADEHREVRLRPPVRGHQHPAAGLHRGRHTHRPQT